MRVFRRAALAALVSGVVLGSVGTVSSTVSATVAANDGTVFSGCISQRTDTSVTLDTSADEKITIDTTWLKQGFKDILLADCVTIQTVTVDGKYVAESVEEGDEPTGNRENRSSKDDHDDDHGSNSGGNND